jgi:hypothetical protein
LLFLSCGQEHKTTNPSPVKNPSNDSGNTVIDFKKDIDTIYHLEINNKNFDLILSQEYPSSTGSGALTTTVGIVENEKHDTLYKKTFEFNEIGELSHPATNCYWLTMINSGGGSGYSGTLFNIRITPEITLQPLVNINELSFWKGNRDASELVLFQSIWNTNGGENNFESHFDEHKQWIGIYKIKEDTVLLSEVGMTKKRYNSFENNGEVDKFKKAEPNLAKAIRWSDYDFSQ